MLPDRGALLEPLPLRLILTMKISLPNPQMLLAPLRNATQTAGAATHRAAAGSTASFLKRKNPLPNQVRLQMEARKLRLQNRTGAANSRSGNIRHPDWRFADAASSGNAKTAQIDRTTFLAVTLPAIAFLCPSEYHLDHYPNAEDVEFTSDPDGFDKKNPGRNFRYYDYATNQIVVSDTDPAGNSSPPWTTLAVSVLRELKDPTPRNEAPLAHSVSAMGIAFAASPEAQEIKATLAGWKTEAETIGKILEKIAEEAHSGIGRRAEKKETVMHDVARIAGRIRLTSDGSHLIKVVDHNAKIQAVCVAKVKGDALEISDLVSAPGNSFNHRKNGVRGAATAALQAAERLARAQGLGKLVLTTVDSAKGFYEKNGFTGNRNRLEKKLSRQQ